jgi:hypothetical protein
MFARECVVLSAGSMRAHFSYVRSHSLSLVDHFGLVAGRRRTTGCRGGHAVHCTRWWQQCRFIAIGCNFVFRVHWYVPLAIWATHAFILCVIMHVCLHAAVYIHMYACMYVFLVLLCFVVIYFGHAVVVCSCLVGAGPSFSSTTIVLCLPLIALAMTLCWALVLTPLWLISYLLEGLAEWPWWSSLIVDMIYLIGAIVLFSWWNERMVKVLTIELTPLPLQFEDKALGASSRMH